MKRIILFIILANIYLGISSAQEVQLSQKHGWDEDYPLYGKIHIFTVLRYDVSDQFGELVKRLKSRRVITFNEHGHICESICYNDQNQAQWTSFYKYDSNQRLIEETSYYSSGVLYEKRFLKYDINGNMTRGGNIIGLFLGFDVLNRNTVLFAYLLENLLYHGVGRNISGINDGNNVIYRLLSDLNTRENVYCVKLLKNTLDLSYVIVKTLGNIVDKILRYGKSEIF